MELDYRGFQIGDLEFITASWLNHQRNSDFGKSMRKSVFYVEHSKLVKSALEKNQILISCSVENKEVIYSYLIGFAGKENDIIHFIFTKPNFRKMGIVKKLLEVFKVGNNLIETHKSKIKYYNMYDSCTYNPYLFLRGDGGNI